MKKSSIIVAFIILLISVGWILSGQIPKKIEEEETDSSLNNITDNKIELVKVRTEKSVSKKFNKLINIQGQTKANRMISISSETLGRIIMINEKKGEKIEKGDLLFKISQDELKIRIDENKARLSSARSQIDERKSKLNEFEIQFNSEKNLFDKGLSSKSKFANAKANLDSARSNLDTAKSNLALVKSELDLINNELEKTIINAPFDGIMTTGHMEIGEFVQPGSVLANFIELDPILAIGYVSEKELKSFSLGSNAFITTSLNDKIKGEISYISPIAEEGTRTFRIEITILNKNFLIKDGLTTTIEIQGRQVLAHKISPSILSLMDNGEIGIKIVNKESIVEFFPIDVISDTNQGMWISGIPDTSDIIVVGQEYATIGKKVDQKLIN
ncbi:MAG: Cobalt-zinc-cadmium resistance protein CzcB [Alphaproteobacteria bacterium MarineAlpha5_Bin11]|nr:MAG: Cobalt-zinc-cadmium resistance protein CzcB [Alphaproteobacteria bacterium MarineAlpha5_Bin11]|tara:strand:+ start:29508 stop:30668 length:1161 start_codon:yes stop_codon:yes gene_type:complete